MLKRKREYWRMSQSKPPRITHSKIDNLNRYFWQKLTNWHFIQRQIPLDIWGGYKFVIIGVQRRIMNDTDKYTDLYPSRISNGICIYNVSLKMLGKRSVLHTIPECSSFVFKCSVSSGGKSNQKLLLQIYLGYSSLSKLDRDPKHFPIVVGE